MLGWSVLFLGVSRQSGRYRLGGQNLKNGFINYVL
jgi:hypothetical protein